MNQPEEKFKMPDRVDLNFSVGEKRLLKQITSRSGILKGIRPTHDLAVGDALSTFRLAASDREIEIPILVLSPEAFEDQDSLMDLALGKALLAGQSFVDGKVSLVFQCEKPASARGCRMELTLLETRACLARARWSEDGGLVEFLLETGVEVSESELRKCGLVMMGR